MRTALLSLVLLTGCATPSTPSPAPPGPPAPAAQQGGPWQSKLDATNPLVGRLWDTRARAFLDEDAMLRQANEADVVLLGEKHDNPDHHRLQARVLQGVAARKPTVVLEMIERDQQEALDTYLQQHPGDAAGLDRKSVV